MGTREPWWKTQLPAVERFLHGQLGRRLPSRRWEHDDLVNETLLGLSEWIKRRGATYRVWDVEPADETEREAFFGLARVILQRRLADRLRLRSREWRVRVEADEEGLARVPNGEPAADRQVLLRQMLETTVEVLATLKPADRDLMAISTTGSQILGPRERQQLRRLRRKILDAIIRRLGATAAELLRIE